MPKNRHAKETPKKTPQGKKKNEGPEGGEESCRCKEVAKKTPKELLRVAIDDLSFWKKRRKN